MSTPRRRPLPRIEPRRPFSSPKVHSVGCPKFIGRLMQGPHLSPDCPPHATPTKSSRTPVPRRTLFPKSRGKSMLVFSFDKNWRQSFKGKALPSSVSLGLQVPWNAQNCCLCTTHLRSIGEAWRHAKQVHRPRRILLICAKCAGYKTSIRRATTHAPKCQLRKKKRSTPQTSHPCSECPRSFSTLRGLSLHRRRMHLESFLQQVRGVNRSNATAPRTVWSETEIDVLKTIMDALGTEMEPSPPKSGVRAKLGLAFRTPEFKHVKPKPMTPLLVNQWTRLTINKIKKMNPRFEMKAEKPPGLKRGLTHPRLQFKMGQETAEKSLASVASEILDEQSNMQCGIDGRLIYSTYKGIWERADTFKSLGSFSNAQPADNSHFALPISENEVVTSLKQLKREGAPGPDGLKKNELSEWDPKGTKLARLFNTWLVSGKLPILLKGSRTVLIPKSNISDELRQIKCWRPITIGPILLRLFSGILTHRLARACSIHPRQRGFVKAPGCAENLLILKGLMESCKKEKKSAAVVFIDFAKAFDTVSHSHIDAVLEQRGVDELIRGIIKNSYRRCYSRIQTAEGPLKKIFLKVGVKQGDPMSPLLFNLALDPLLYKLEEIGKGFEVGQGSSISAMAYADDLVLLSSSWDGMQFNLRILEKFAELTGLAVNPAKCHSFLIQKGKPVVGARAWMLRGQPIHNIGPSESVKYLGIEINPWKGLLKPPIRETLRILLDRVSKAKVKPTVKLDLLRTFVVPRLSYVADFGSISRSLLNDCDRDIRSEVRRWLHLHPTTANGLLYSSFRDGGLNIPRLSVTIPSTQLRRQIGLLKSPDVVTRYMADSCIDRGALVKTLKSLTGGDISYEKGFIHHLNFKRISGDALKSKEFKRWMKFKFYGHGVKNFRCDKISNCWLRKPCEAGFSQTEFILGLKLRSNSLPVKASVMYGAGAGSSVSCRLCGDGNETFRHVLSQCAGLRAVRMRRHNNVCKLLRTVCQNNHWRVEMEKRLSKTDGKIGVPDLIAIKGDQAMIIDVTIPLESNDMSLLAKAAAHKMDKYTPFRESVRKLFPGVKTVTVWGFPIGARGKWFDGNTVLLQTLGVPKIKCKSIARCFSKLALWGTIKMCKGFKTAIPEV
uniref:Reverse transcriptase domain-containing protein n=1 Tax=Sphaeramia orbicularis TaxID=375764 RepID=A0A673B3A2_9TELE